MEVKVDSWDEDTVDRVSKVIKSTSSRIARKFRGYTTFQDTQQDAVEWCLKNKKVIDDRINDHDEQHRRAGERYVGKSLLRHLEREARKIKAAKVGYRTSDEFFYSDVMILELLKARGVGAREATEELPSEVRRKRQGHPSGMDYEVMIADIDRALARLEPTDRALVLALYQDDTPVGRVMDQFELSRYEVESRSSRALFQMVEQLGGPSPWR